MACLDNRLILYNLVWDLVLKGGVLNYATVVFMKLFCSTCCMLPKSVYGYMTMLKRVYVYACIIALISKTPFEIKISSSRDMGLI